MELIKEYNNRTGYFIKTFFVNEELNKNKWKLEGTPEEILNDVKSGLEKSYFGKTAPIILRDDLAHPSDHTADMIKEQEKNRVGSFIDVILEKSDNIAVIAELTDKNAIAAYESGSVTFVSPSIHILDGYVSLDGVTHVKRFRVNHLAMVADPAYGLQAQIKGRCIGTLHSCSTALDSVQAAVDDQSLQVLTRPELLPKTCKEEALKAEAGKIKTIMDNDNPEDCKKNDNPSAQTENCEELKKQLQSVQAELDQLKQSIDNETKKPLAEGIVDAQVKLGKIKADQSASVISDLMKLKIEDLKSLSAAYKTVTDKLTEENHTVRFPYVQAAVETKDSKLLTMIRSRMGA